MSSIGDRIRRARQYKGISQEELARLIDTTKSTISKYELDRREPRLDTLQRIASALGISYYDLLPTDVIEVIPGRLKIVRSSQIDSKFLTYNIEAADEEAYNIGLQIFERAGVSISEHSPAVLINKALSKLNPDGQAKAVERVEELTEIPKYRRDTETPTEAPSGPTETE